MFSIDLSSTVIDFYKIQEYQHNGPSGQKSVFIVSIDNKKYALKIIKNADERAIREINIYKEYASNKGIPTILSVNKFSNDTIVLEEYIEGNDLSELVHQYKGNEKKITKLIYDIATILQPIWENRYVHRDLKPQNIRIRANGEPVVLDFGIARALDSDTITAAGVQPLTWSFASPEQYFGQKNLISYRTDFFCLGIIAHYLFTGILPFGSNRKEVEEVFETQKSILSISNTKLLNFCEQTLKFNCSERPGKITTFLNLLK